jgi:streptogramin lyase
VLAQTIGRCATALGVALVIATLSSASAGAAAGTITEYPIPVETTPYGIATGPDGKIWFVDSGNHTGGASIGRMATSGAISSSDVLQLPTPELGYAATLGPDGKMWVAQDKHIDSVPVGATLTSEITSYALGHGNGGFGSIVPGPDGRLWFGWKGQLGAITTSGLINEYETNTATAVGVTEGPEGKLWYGEENKIARMDSEGHTKASEDFSLPVGDSGIRGLVLGPDGNIWFSLALPAAVGRITPAGTITIFPTPTLNSLPSGLAVGPDKQIWFAESNGNAIGTIPTTATSGADIVEYPLAFSNTNPLYMTAGPDGRMWFTEFNRGALGAITTNAVAPPGTPTGGETPVSSLPGPGSPPRFGSTPGAASTPAFPRLPAPVGCAANRLVLTDVFPQAGKTQVLGVAPAAAIGKKVTILSTWNGKPVGTAKVGADLSFRAALALPPRSLRFTNRARYFAKLGSIRSGELKLTRRMYSTSITAAGRAITFSGDVTRPFAKQLERVTIRAAASCNAVAGGAIVAKVTLTRSGTFSATFHLPASLQNASKLYLQARTRVRQNEHSSKTYPTSTLIRGVKLTP